ncbi:S-adenosyl-L-methionine-dependent methyltransferase [Stipitochalara longipes BDJ]|nr:S-adenosyl-L-methionine-dependent methyltransferase [Stipitochalara longipes BDJ]
MAAVPQLYDTLQRPYDYIRTSTIASIERENVRETVAPFINDARVLELASSSILGVDISSVMIDEARRIGKEKKVAFIQADCTIPRIYDGGLFDIVFGAWLLNYAPDCAELIKMFRTISLNLKDGGHFVAVTIAPSSNPIELLIAEAKARPMPAGSGWITHQYIKDVEDGIYMNVHGNTPIGELNFKCYHLKREVYEEAAREAGLKGEIEWGVTKVLDSYLKGEGLGDASLAELESYKTIPHFGVLVIVK